MLRFHMQLVKYKEYSSHANIGLSRVRDEGWTDGLIGDRRKEGRIEMQIRNFARNCNLHVYKPLLHVMCLLFILSPGRFETPFQPLLPGFSHRDVSGLTRLRDN